MRYLLLFLLVWPFIFKLHAKKIDDNEFKALFMNYLPAELKEYAHYYIYKLPDELKNDEKKNLDILSEKEWMDTVEKTLLKKNPLAYLELGKKEPLSPILWPPSHKRPKITLIFIPGILGEFIDDLPFSEIFDPIYQHNSPLFFNWINSYNQLKKDNPLKWDAKLSLEDTHYPQETLNEKPYLLDEFVRVSGIPDQNLDIVALRLPPLSLESLASEKLMARVYLRRLTKFFSIIKERTPKNTFLLGYSRGASVALEIMSELNKNPSLYEEHPWARSIKGAITLGGTIYGSRLADYALEEEFIPHSHGLKKLKKTTSILIKLGRSLKYKEGAPFPAQMAIIFKNNITFIKALNSLRKVAMKKAPHTSKPQSKTSLLKLNPLPSLHHLFNMAFHQLHLNAPLSEYDDNIHKFKLFLKYFEEGGRELTTKRRLEWWRQSKLPTKNTDYYSLVATMVSPLTDPSTPPLAHRPYIYAYQSVDDDFLFGSYESLLEETQLLLNDSQMLPHQATFWTNYNALLNPYYKAHPLKTTLLGLLGTHHWGMALPQAFVMKSPKINPYPRLALLQAITETLQHNLDTP